MGALSAKTCIDTAAISVELDRDAHGVDGYLAWLSAAYFERMRLAEEFELGVLPAPVALGYAIREAACVAQDAALRRTWPYRRAALRAKVREARQRLAHWIGGGCDNVAEEWS